MFRFTIRDVLWLTVVVGMASGWWFDRRCIQQDRDMWKFHAAGAKELASWGVREVAFYGPKAIAQHPRNGTLSREWPYPSWYHDEAAAPSRP